MNKPPIQCKIFKGHDEHTLQLDLAKFLNNSEISVIDIHYSISGNDVGQFNAVLYSFAVFYRKETDVAEVISGMVQ